MSHFDLLQLVHLGVDPLQHDVDVIHWLLHTLDVFANFIQFGDEVV